MITFEAFPKIPRMRRTVCVTEKIDGTNAAVQIRPMADVQIDSPLPIAEYSYVDQHGEYKGMYGIWAQSRSHFITPTHDNYGFAKWVSANAQELISGLGEGAHFGEWWGEGIQRRYIQQKKHFSLFNVARWAADRDTPPECCRVVPILGYVEHDGIQAILDHLRENGSVAAPGFMKPEGVVVYHTQSRQLYKILLEGDEAPKGQLKEVA